MTTTRAVLIIITSVLLYGVAVAQNVTEPVVTTVTVIDRPERAPDERPFEAIRWSSTRADAELRLPLDTALANGGWLATGYSLETLFGRAALAADSVSADRTERTIAFAGLLPDDRIIVVTTTAPTAAFGSDAIDVQRVIDDFTVSSALVPTLRRYQRLWSVPLPDEYEWRHITLDARYVYVELPSAVDVFDGTNGSLMLTIPFDAPAQVSGFTALDGIVYVGDRACRCIRRTRVSDGRWLDPIGTFAGGAPIGIGLMDSAIIAIDGREGMGYQRRVFPVQADGTVGRERPSTPYDSTEGVIAVMKTLAYPLLIDSIPNAPDTIRGWDTAGDRLALITSDGVMHLLSDALTPIRYGSERLSALTPVIGTVSADRPSQGWAWSGTAGDMCLYATDLARPFQDALGLDMAITVRASDGSVIAENDDHASDGLYGSYDAAICPIALESGENYVVDVTWIAGEGGYALAAVPTRTLDSSARVLQTDGTILEMIPTERHRYDARAGDTLTLTLTARDGDLDPALALIAPDGSLIASNDDAADLTLGVNAQIVQARLPVDGTYIIAAGRWSGTGRYDLIVTNTAP